VRIANLTSVEQSVSSLSEPSSKTVPILCSNGCVNIRCNGMDISVKCVIYSCAADLLSR
jgi:hypothetical protein